MTAFVLDASVTLAWAFADEESAYADDVIGSLDTRSAIIPVIWPLEMTNALLAAIRRGRIEPVGALRLMSVLNRFHLVIVQEPSPSTIDQRIFDIGITHNLTSYDATYLELALRRGLPLATQNARLAAAAASSGVEIFEP